MARSPQPSPAEPTAEPEIVGANGKKGAPTPSRKQQEAARKRPLVPNDRKERRAQERAAQAVAREKQRIGIENGDERYLPVRDRGPQRRYVRDYIDARWSVGELMIPAIAIFFITSFFPTVDAVVYAGFALMWFVIFATIVDMLIVWRILRKKLTAKFGEAQKGYRFYSIMRAIYFRRLRPAPKPQVARGDFPE